MKKLLRLLALSLAFALVGNTSAAAESDQPDLPACEAIADAAAAPLSIGLVQPYAGTDVLRYAVKLARQGQGVTVCGEAWSGVLPRFTPWAAHLERGYGWGLYAAGFLAVLMLLTAVTPRQRWRRTTLIGILSIAGGTWLAGVSLVGAFHAVGGQRLVYGTVVSLRPARQAVPDWVDVSGARELAALLAQRHLLAGTPAEPDSGVGAAAAPSPRPMPEGRYHTHNWVNLRTAPGTAAPRLLLIPTGRQVTYDGAMDGDWWRITTESGQVGWASSIFLRRLDEAVPAGNARKIVVKH